VLIMLGLILLVVLNAGGVREAARVGRSILIVVGGLVLLAALFALLVTKPNL
jgi:hypothetical protein